MDCLFDDERPIPYETYFRLFIFKIVNKDTADLRLKIANACLDDMIRWFASGGQCGILDGSNTTEERRRDLVERFKSVDVHYMFIESICDNPIIIDSNIRSVKVSSPDVCITLHFYFLMFLWENKRGRTSEGYFCLFFVLV